MSASVSLYELGDRLQAIAETLIENGGELTPELAVQLEQLEGAFDEKVERILLHAQNLHATAAAASQEAERLTALATSRERAADRLREYVKREMEVAKIDKVTTPLVEARVVQNGRPAIRWTLPIAELAERFKKVTVTLDGNAAYAELKETQRLPIGFTVERGSHLRVK